MADIDDITRILTNGIRFGAIGRVHPKQIDAAAGRLAHHRAVGWKDLEKIGRDLAGDRVLFSEVNIELLNKILDHSELVTEPRHYE